MNPIRRYIRHLFRMDRGDAEAHAIKNQMTADILEIRNRIREVNEYIENSTAYKVAKAAGRDRR